MTTQQTAEAATGVPLKTDNTPPYPELGQTVAKFRRLASKGLANMLVTDRRAYADAIETAIKAKQREEMYSGLGKINRGSPERSDPIGDARLAKLNRELLAAPSKERRARTPQKWQEMYAEAMKEKIAREFAEYDASEGRAPKPPHDYGKTIGTGPSSRPTNPHPDSPAGRRAPKPKPAPIVTAMERKAKLPAKAEAESTRPTAAAGYAIVPMKQKGKFVVKVDRLPDGSKAMPEVVIGNQIKCRFSHRDAGYIASAAQIEKFERIVSTIA